MATAFLEECIQMSLFYLENDGGHLLSHGILAYLSVVGNQDNLRRVRRDRTVSPPVA